MIRPTSYSIPPSCLMVFVFVHTGTGTCGSGPSFVSRRPRGPVRHASGRDDLRAQLLDRRAMAHRGLPDQRKGIFFGKRVSAHHLQYRGEDDAPRADAILQFLDMGGPSIRRCAESKATTSAV